MQIDVSNVNITNENIYTARTCGQKKKNIV